MMDPGAIDQRFPPERRFHNGRDFGRVFHRQQKAAGKHLVVLVAPRPKRGPRRARLGVMVSAKVHKHAVRRHQLKRWVREWFRCGGQHRAHGHEVLVLFRSDPATDGHQALDQDLDRLLAKALESPARPGSNRRRS